MHLTHTMRLPVFSLERVFLILILRESMWAITREAASSDMSIVNQD